MPKQKYNSDEIYETAQLHLEPIIDEMLRLVITDLSKLSPKTYLSPRVTADRVRKVCSAWGIEESERVLALRVEKLREEQ